MTSHLQSAPRRIRRFAPAVFALAAGLLTPFAPLGGQAWAQTTAAAPAIAPAGQPFTAQQLEALLPATVFLQGKTAPLQLRNAGGATLANGRLVWAALVDTSGYATAVQERYQFYLVTEGPLRIGTARLAAGAYGGGFVGNRFVILDVGGHPVAEGAVTPDPAIGRPRPLQFLPAGEGKVKLALGRQAVVLSADPAGAGR